MENKQRLCSVPGTPHSSCLENTDYKFCRVFISIIMCVQEKSIIRLIQINSFCRMSSSVVKIRPMTVKRFSYFVP